MYRIKAALSEGTVTRSCGDNTGLSERLLSLGSSSPTSNYLWNTSAGVG